jgi:hypothetical protein
MPVLSKINAAATEMTTAIATLTKNARIPILPFVL